MTEDKHVKKLINDFEKEAESTLLATDQLLSAIHLMSTLKLNDAGWEEFRANLWRGLNESPKLDQP